MLSFLARAPPKTPQAHLKVIRTEDNETIHEFFTDDPDASYGMKSTWKPGSTIQPCHWHKHQTIFILVHSGIMRVTLEDDEDIIHTGAHITIKPGLYHAFHNHSDTERLITSTVLMLPAESDRDEAFFRNWFGYLDDCRRADMAPHVAQLCLFLWFFDCYPALPGPRFLAKLVSQIRVFVLGVLIGKWLLGFRESYPEYYRG